MNATATTATRITLDDVIVTRHGSNYGTVEIDRIERAGTTPAGVALIKVTGYQMVRAGCCGPFENVYRADDTVEMAA